MTGQTSTEIDEGYVARRRTDVAAEELDGETVIWDARNGSLHILNPAATIVWNCLDGTVDIGQLAGELSEAFGVEAGRMAADVLQTVRSFGEQGLLEGVAGASTPGQEDSPPAPIGGTHGAQEPNHEPRFLPPPPAG